MARPSAIWQLALPIALVALVVLSPVTIATPVKSTTQPALTYTVTPGDYNNTVLVAPSGSSLPDPVIVAGPSPTNLSQQDVYVIGMSASELCTNGYYHLVVIRSTNGGESFGAPINTSVCGQSGATGGAVGAIILPNGTLVVSVPGSIVVSSDGGATWTTTATFDAEFVYLTRDEVTGALYYLDWDATFGNSGGPGLLGVSYDGGYSWDSSFPTPDDFEGLNSIAAWNNTLVVSGFWSPPGYPYNTTYPALVPAVTSYTIAANGTRVWTNDTLLMSDGLTCAARPPMVTASTSGVFAAVCSGGPNGTGDTNDSLVSYSFDAGWNWTSPAEIGNAPSGVILSGWNTAVFNSQNQLTVVWVLYDSNFLSGNLTVSSANESARDFNSTSFSVRFQSPLYQDGDWGPNLAADSSRVWLAWYSGTISAGTGSNNSTAEGTFVREIAGAATGNIQNDSNASSTASTSVTVSLRSVANASLVQQVTWTGQYFTLSELPPGTYEVWLGSGLNSSWVGSIPVRTWSQTNFTIRANEVTPPPVFGGNSAAGPGSLVWWLTGIVAAGATVLLAVFVLVPYARLTRESALQQKVRFVLFEYIREHPGASFSEVRDVFGLRNGAAAYHLGVLEKQGFVRSDRRTYRRFYFSAGKPVPGTSLPLSELQGSILATVRTEPGIGVREISRRIGRDHATVGYNVKALTRDGHLKVDRVGVRLLCYLADPTATT